MQNMDNIYVNAAQNFVVPRPPPRSLKRTLNIFIKKPKHSLKAFT